MDWVAQVSRGPNSQAEHIIKEQNARAAKCAIYASSSSSYEHFHKIIDDPNTSFKFEGPCGYLSPCDNPPVWPSGVRRGGGAYCVPDKQKVQPYGSTTHDMISEEGSDPKRSAEYWADEAQKAYQWYRGGAGQ